MDKQQLKKMFDDYLAGKLTGEEKAQAEKWFDEARIYDEASVNWSEEDQERLLEQIHQRMSIPDEAPVRTLTFGRWLQIAATVLILALASVYVWNRTVSPDTMYAEGLQKLILEDGTIVWLKGNSTLSYPERFTGDLRQVALQGEALFEVTKDPTHPFIIQCGELTAKVLGTSFNIKAGEKNIEVTVLTGKVNVSSAQNAQGIDVLPNEKAMYDKSLHQITKLDSPEKEIAEVTSNTEYNMHFDRTSVREIMRRVESKFNVNVTIEGNTLDRCTVTANLTDKSLEATLKSISGLFNFNYTVDADKITIRGGSCE